MSWHSSAKSNVFMFAGITGLVLIDFAALAARDHTALGLAFAFWPAVIGAVALWFLDRWSDTPRFCNPRLLLATLFLLGFVQVINVAALFVASIDC